jgi:CDP-diacylglycerol--serine O-phosphatidyltransferase
MFFKTKDLVTVANIGGGLGAMIVAMEGMNAATPEIAQTYVFWSGFLILLAWFFDTFDGTVARLLKQVNQFGAEFDNVADLVSYSIAPAFVLYLVYRKAVILPGLENHPDVQFGIALAMASVPVLSGCIRFARFNVRKLDVQGLWIGFPRPASALTIIALVNCHLFQISPLMAWLGIPFVLALGIMNLSLVPFIGHHDRLWSWYLKIILNFVWMTVAISVAFGIILKWLPPRLAFDWILVWLSYYLFIGWTDIPGRTRQEIAALTRDWND